RFQLCALALGFCKMMKRNILVFLILGLLTVAVACGRQQFSSVPADNKVQLPVSEKPQTLPFDGEKKGLFHSEPKYLPTGTAIAVRLQDSLSSASTSSGQSFEAV